MEKALLGALIFVLFSTAVYAPGNETVLYDVTNACTDSDGGKNYDVRGTATANGQSLTDHCNSDGTLTEKYCGGTGITAETHSCPGICAEGACTSCTTGDVKYGTCSNGNRYIKYNCAENRWVTVNYVADPCMGNIVCPAVCRILWEIRENTCVVNECGSGCGANGATTFNTEEECRAKLGATSYKYASYSCNDGYIGRLGDGIMCKPAATWRSMAEAACNNRCKAQPTGATTVNQVTIEGLSCGMSGFRVDVECSTESSTCGNGICETGEASYCPPSNCTSTTSVPVICPAALCKPGTCPSDCEEMKVCPAVCIEMWKLTEGQCVFNECGSGCGPDNVKTFRTEAECKEYVVPVCNNNGVCESNERSCKDCVGTVDCPLTKKCESGETVTCYRKTTGCACTPCAIPADDLPYGCTQERDESGFIRVVCSTYAVDCPDVSDDVFLKCEQNGGVPVTKEGPNGCSVFVCSFGGGGTTNPLFGSGSTCPDASYIKEKIAKCNNIGLKGFVVFEGGCNVPRCGNEKTECPPVSESDKLMMKERCATYNKTIAVGYEAGCQKLKCAETNFCGQDLPKEAYAKCADMGGQVIVKRDDRGCVAFSECVQRGDDKKTYVKSVDAVPDSSDLLVVAFRLEELRVSLDKLARKSSDIADYYRMTGSTEEKRFRRVSDMFNAATEKVDEIRTKIRGRLDSLTTDDIKEIKRDIRYLKDVVIKDILYLMLSNDDDIDGVKNDTKKNCGNDDECFTDAFRICQPITFRPDDRTSVEIQGLEDNKCVVYANAFGLDMTCRIEKYSLGLDDPDKSVFPYCSGKLVGVISAMTKQGEPSQSVGVTPGTNMPYIDGKPPVVVSPTDVAGPLVAGGGTSQGGGSPAQVSGTTEACLGCLNNGVCDPGECSTCVDCG